MKNLLLKEFKLAMHPTTIVFWLLSAMLMIPNYPYGVVFFYTGLGLFFVCLTGRENHDIEYMTSLPIRKRDIVKARICFAVTVEAIQLAICLLVSLVKRAIGAPANTVGMEANLALTGCGLILLGIFNWVFFTRYYKAPDKVGTAFVWASVVFFVMMLVLEAPTYFVPYVQQRLDTLDAASLWDRVAFMAIGLIVFAALTWGAYRKSASTFERLDL